MVRLGDVFPLIRNGASIKQTDGAGGIPITRIETIANREIDREKFGYADIECEGKYQDYLLQDGDILMSHINSEKHLGKVARYKAIDEEKIIHGMNLLMLRADSQTILPAYAEYYFNSDSFLRQIPNITKKSVNQASFTVSALKELQIQVPSMACQQKIAEVLDKVSDLIALRKQQLAKLDELVKARFVEMFGGIHDSVLYPYESLSSFAVIKSGGTPDRGTPEYWNDGNIRWVKTTELQNCIIWDTEEKITELAVRNSSAKLIPADSILIAMYGQGKTRGMTGYLAVESTTNQACACILPSDAIDQNYLWHYLILSYDKLRDMAKGGNQPNLNAGIIKAFPVLMPPMEMQEQFSAFTIQINKSKLALQQSMARLELLKKALMQKYFG